jgi:ubiquinone/menaquinone biosynthesis C-methylase UbiE
MSQPFNSEAFQKFEFAGWEKIALPYQSAFGPLTSQAAAAIVEVLNPSEASYLLDVASGPGYLAALAAKRGAKVIGIDFSPQVVEGAKSLYPNLRFEVANAEALPFADNSFNVLGMNFGLLHLANPEIALAEAYRALLPGGNFAATVWASPKETIGFGLILDAIQQYGTLNPRNVSIPDGPAFFRFSEYQEFERVLHEAGFRNIAIRQIPLVWQLPSSDSLFDIMYKSSVRNAALLYAQSEDTLSAIKTAVEIAAQEYQKENGTVELLMPAVLAIAIKPYK